MKTDVRGASTCPAGEENYETYCDNILKRPAVQYDYRTPEGRLFSTVAFSLEKCRERRDKWLRNEKSASEGVIEECDKKRKLALERASEALAEAIVMVGLMHSGDINCSECNEIRDINKQVIALKTA